ncbi:MULTISPECIES: LysR substrate-binding domain-containing protein [Streptomyces]|uniref:LysR substrate-binding domain-containing protein n=1 Tax=Streptomyces TaxID=1883 RepID=UPI0031D96D12
MIRFDSATKGYPDGTVAVAAGADEPFVHYTADNGNAIRVDQFVERHQVALRPVLRTRSPRTAVQLTRRAGMGVTDAPVSALAARPTGVVRRLEPAVHRGVVAITETPSDALVSHFMVDLHRSGLPVVDLSV